MEGNLKFNSEKFRDSRPRPRLLLNDAEKFRTNRNISCMCTFKLLLSPSGFMHDIYKNISVNHIYIKNVRMLCGLKTLQYECSCYSNTITIYHGYC
jgi:hypothetical protein